MRKALRFDWDKPLLRLYPVGDVHVGSMACREDAIAKLANIIANDKDGMAVGIGDYIEAIAPTDKRFDANELSKPISPQHINNPFYTQSLRFCKLFEKTAGKWIAFVAGNHEDTARARYSFDPLPIIAERLGGVHLGETDNSGWLRIGLLRKRTGHSIADIHLAHGSTGGAMRGGDALSLQRYLWRKKADLVIVGHGHKPMAFPDTIEYIDKANMVTTETRWGVENFALVDKHAYLARSGGNAPCVGYCVITLKIIHGSSDCVKISIEMNEL